MSSENVKKTGTTTLALVCKDCVVIATEQRATMGTLIAHKSTKKLYKIDNHLALATAGLVGDLQVLARYLSAEANLYRLKRESPMPVESAATLMSNIMNQRKFMPYYVQLILGGYDAAGGLDPASVNGRCGSGFYNCNGICGCILCYWGACELQIPYI